MVLPAESIILLGPGVHPKVGIWSTAAPLAAHTRFGVVG